MRIEVASALLVVAMHGPHFSKSALAIASRVTTAVVVASLLGHIGIAGQVPRFEGVSMKRSAGGAAIGPLPRGVTVVDPLASGRFVAKNASLYDLLVRAYGLHRSQLLNGPGWTLSERFDIETSATSVPP